MPTDNQTTAWDRPVTDAELSAHCGEEATQYEVTQAIHKHAAAFDADDLQTIVGELFTQLNGWFGIKAYELIGWTISAYRRHVIADRASLAVYGRVGVITAEMVNE